MALVFHIVIALASVGFATYMFLLPSKAKFKVSYGLIAGTLLSGTYLAASHPSYMLRTCISGLLYTGTVTVITVAAQRKLAYAQSSRTNRKD